MHKLLSNYVTCSQDESVQGPHYKLSFEIKHGDNQALGGNNVFEGAISNKSSKLLAVNRRND